MIIYLKVWIDEVVDIMYRKKSSMPMRTEDNKLDIRRVAE